MRASRPRSTSIASSAGTSRAASDHDGKLALVVGLGDVRRDQDVGAVADTTEPIDFTNTTGSVGIGAPVSAAWSR